MAKSDLSQDVVVIFRNGQRIKIEASKGAENLVSLFGKQLAEGAHAANVWIQDRGVMICVSEIVYLGPTETLLD